MPEDGSVIEDNPPSSTRPGRGSGAGPGDHERRPDGHRIPGVGPDVLTRLEGADVLVTGGAGFVGGRLASALAPVCDVTVLDDLRGGTAATVPEGARFVRGDVRDVETVLPLLADAEVVFHQAGLVDAGTSVRAPVETHTRNAGGAMTVLDAARRTDTRVVLASSADVYGPSRSLPVAETDPTRPVTPLGVSKLAAEGYARSFAESYGLETVALRYFDVYGVRESGSTGPCQSGSAGSVAEFVERARRGDPLAVPVDDSSTRDYVHVDDAVQATVRAAVADVTGVAVNVGTGVETPVRSVAELVRAELDATSQLVPVEGRYGDDQPGCASIDRARDRLGYEPTVRVEAGVRAVCRRSVADRPVETAQT